MTTYPKGMNLENGRWVYRCPEQGCYHALQYPSQDSNTDHKCPHMNGTTKIAWSGYGPSLLQQSWNELDGVTARIMEGDRSEKNIGYARGLAWVIALFMCPHLGTLDDVSREAAKRYKMHKAGEEYETPGLGSRKYEPPPDDHKLDTKPARATAKAAPAKKKLTEQEEAAIRNAVVMFSKEELAKTYGVTVAQIDEIVGNG